MKSEIFRKISLYLYFLLFSFSAVLIIINPEIGKKYRETILEKGDSLPADELYRLFMGREPDSDAFLKVHKLNR